MALTPHYPSSKARVSLIAVPNSIWDLVALNSTPSLALHKEPEVAVGTMGIGLDYGGFGVQALLAGDLERILSVFPA